MFNVYHIFTISTGDCLVDNGIKYLPYQLATIRPNWWLGVLVCQVVA